MATQPNALQNLFLAGLKDLYYAENEILKALPKMAEGAYTDEVTAAFEKHQMETEAQVDRLNQVFEILGVEAKGKECPAIDGIIAEGEEILGQYEGTAAVDAGLVAAAQAVEHYEIARYGTLVAWAGVLGITNAAELLQATLDEEEATDEALSELAEGGVNDAAAGGEEEDEEDSALEENENETVDADAEDGEDAAR
jgi:ferritin-like metal-binding protein YciE